MIPNPDNPAGEGLPFQFQYKTFKTLITRAYLEAIPIGADWEVVSRGGHTYRIVRIDGLESQSEVVLALCSFRQYRTGEKIVVCKPLT